MEVSCSHTRFSNTFGMPNRLMNECYDMPSLQEVTLVQALSASRPSGVYYWGILGVRR